MLRFKPLVVIALATLFAFLSLLADQFETRSVSSTSEATPTAASKLCPSESPLSESIDDDFVDARPPDLDDAVIVPTSVPEGEPPPPPELLREFYLVEIKLPPGKCIPVTSVGNQKDGWVVFIVQQGKIEFEWTPLDTTSTPVVKRGDSHDTQEDPVPQDVPQTLYPGDWITMDQQVHFSYRNIGGDSATILKAVWAAPVPDQGCGGGCK